jgi:trehalose 6-phosphate phosphatase
LAVQTALAPLVRAPAEAAIVADFDGTLAAIVDDPSDARPLDGVREVLMELARTVQVVAVLSGRPVSFLLEQLGPDVVDAGVRLVGLYGTEWLNEQATLVVAPGVLEWKPMLDEVAVRLEAGAPPGVTVESKLAGVTVHWRRAPAAATWAAEQMTAEAARSGLVAHPGRMSIELRPPAAIDKGTATRTLVTTCSAACYFGDDLGDLPAFEALAALADERGLTAATIAVVDAESAEAVIAAADIVVDGPLAALGVLRWLAEEANRQRTALS